VNYVPVLSTSCCNACGTECHSEELHGEHAGLCIPCGDDLAEKLAADKAEELLSDAEIIDALLELEPEQVIEAAAAAERMLGRDRFSRAS